MESKMKGQIWDTSAEVTSRVAVNMRQRERERRERKERKEERRERGEGEVREEKLRISSEI